jgi:methionyl aminopeptidase
MASSRFLAALGMTNAVENGDFMSITSPEELEAMRAAGEIVRLMLEAMKREVRPGVTTAELDEAGAAVMRAYGAVSAPAKVYQFPGTSCISVNDEAVHGIPGNRALVEGDLVKLDVTIEKDGFMADAAVTVPVGEISELGQKLVACAEQAFAKAMLVARAGFRVSDIGRAVEREVRRCGFSVIRDLGGHGIGRTIHEEPRVPNFADPEASQILTEGLVITVEPIIAAGSGRATLSNDGWTIRTADCKPSAHYEHTLVITKGAPILLTAA